VTSSTSAVPLPLIKPVLISGPLVSRAIATGRPCKVSLRFSAASLTFLTVPP